MASVLVVDDEPDLRYLAQVTLELDGHQVTTAADGVEAIAALELEVPDVVLLDVMMPGDDGWTVLDQIKHHLDGDISSVRVLMMTALGDDDDRLRGGIEGAVRYLVKPVPAERLRAVIHEVLAGRPEGVQRRRAQTQALVEIAQSETGGPRDDPGPPGPRLSRLEHLRPRSDTTEGEAMVVGDELTMKQRNLVRVLTETGSVSEAASTLDVSRSNVYASLRRVARSLGVDSVPDLLRLVRSGELRVTDE